MHDSAHTDNHKAPTFHIMFFCLGNICRSPLAEALFRYHSQQNPGERRWHVASSGTSDFHIGEPPDPGSQRVLQRRLGVDISGQRAQQLCKSHFSQFDMLVAMDEDNLRTASKLAGTMCTKLVTLRRWEPQPDLRHLGVPDPWGRGEKSFEEVFDIVHRCTRRLLDAIAEQDGPPLTLPHWPVGNGR